jgi:O-antigen/teichoic acid export membrane protein
MADLPRGFRRSVTSSYLRTVAQAVVALVLTPVLVHGLGKTEYGIWTLVLSLAVYLELFEFGLGAATVKSVAEDEARGDRERTRRSIATSFWMLAVPGVAALLFGGLIAAVFPLVFDIPATSDAATRILVLLIALDLAISIPSDTFGNTLMALQRYDLINLTLVVVLFAQAIAWAVVMALDGGLVALGVVTVVLSLAGQLSRFLIVRRLMPGISVSPRLVDRERVRPLAGLSVWYALAELSTLVIARLDVVVVGLVVGVPEAAVYAVGQKLAFLAQQAIQPITLTFFPHASELAARRDREGLRATILTGTRVSMAVAGPITITLALLAEPTLRVWVGDDFAEGSLVVVYLAAATAVSALTRTGFEMLQGAGIARPAALVSVFEATLNLSLSIVLGRSMGLQGVALATLIAASIAQLGILLPYLGRTFGLGQVTFLWTMLGPHVPAAVAALVVGWGFRQRDISDYAELIVAGLAIGGSYLAVLMLARANRSELRLALAYLRGR